jgi:DNA replication protein
MKTFSGFPEGKVPVITLPEVLFSQLIPLIDDLDELKVTVLVLYKLSLMQSEAAPWISLDELQADHAIRSAVEFSPERSWQKSLERALARAVTRGSLLVYPYILADQSIEMRYFANSPRGRATVNALKRGENPARYLTEQRPDIFSLYEQNIGPLTALISEDLMEAESTFPMEWIEEAFHEAVLQNKRSWKYVYAILRRWQEEGKDEISRRNRERGSEEHKKGEYQHLIKH